MDEETGIKKTIFLKKVRDESERHKKSGKACSSSSLEEEEEDGEKKCEKFSN